MSVASMVTHEPPRRSVAEPVRDRVAAVVLLAGELGGSALSRVCGGSLLRLPVTPGVRLLDYWVKVAEAVHASAGRRLPFRVLTQDPESIQALTDARCGAVLSVEQDPKPLRGAGGVLRDLAQGYAADQWLVAVSAKQLLRCDLWWVIKELWDPEAAMGITADGHGGVGAVVMARCGALLRLPERGFVDLKEQALPAMASTGRVVVRRWCSPLAQPVRDLGGYLEALREGGAAGVGSPDEPWLSRFGLVESGAQVDPTAVLHDAVVLAGARVGPGAVVARSVLGPGAVVKRGELVTDAVLPLEPRGGAS